MASLEPWHILVVAALPNARQLQPNKYVCHKIPGRLYDGKTVAEFRRGLSTRFSALIKEERKSLPKGTDEQGCVVSVHDPESLVKLMATDSVQEMASDRRLVRVVALVGQPVFELLRDIHGPIPEFTPEQLEERLSSPRSAGPMEDHRKRSAASAFGDGGRPTNGGGGGGGRGGAGLSPEHGQQAVGRQQLKQEGQSPVAPWQAGKGSPAGAQQGQQQHQQGQRGQREERQERPPMVRQQPPAGAAQRGGPPLAQHNPPAAPQQQPAAAAAVAVPVHAGPLAPGQFGVVVQQQEYGLAVQQASPGPQGYGTPGQGVPPPDLLHQQMMAEQQMLMERHYGMQAQQAQQHPQQLQQQQQQVHTPGLPPHLAAQQAAVAAQQAQLAGDPAAAAQLELYRQQQAQQAAQQAAAQQQGYWQQGPWG